MHSSTEILDALYASGVENWEGYDLALVELSEDDREDDDQVLSALQIAGVDCREGYEEALESLP